MHSCIITCYVQSVYLVMHIASYLSLYLLAAVLCFSFLCLSVFNQSKAILHPRSLLELRMILLLRQNFLNRKAGSKHRSEAIYGIMRTIVMFIIIVMVPLTIMIV